MRVNSVAALVGFLLLVCWVSLCYASDKLTVQVVGVGECADCKQSKIKSSHALSGLKVTIDCKSTNGHFQTRGFGLLDKEGNFKISLPKEMVKDGNLQEECYAQLHNAANAPCAVHSGLEASKITFQSKSADEKHIFAPTGKLKFSSAVCTSAFLWPYYKYPPLPPMPPLPTLPPWTYNHPWFKNYGHPYPIPPISFPPKVYPPISFPPKVFPPIYFPPKVYPPISFPPKTCPPPAPEYTPTPTPPVVEPPPVYQPAPKPPVPVYKPPTVPTYTPKPKPPVYKPPTVPTYTPKPKPKPPVYKPPTVPTYTPKPNPPVYKPPTVPVYTPKPNPPVYQPPTVPIYKPLPPIPQIPPFYKKPCPPTIPLPQLPPLPTLPPKPDYFHHPIIGFPPLAPGYPHP